MNLLPYPPHVELLIVSFDGRNTSFLYLYNVSALTPSITTQRDLLVNLHRSPYVKRAILPPDKNYPFLHLP